MRVGKKANVVAAKKTRSCVVRLEKVQKSSPNVSPAQEDIRIKRTSRLSSTSSAMAPTPKGGRRGVIAPPPVPQELKAIGAVNKKRVIGNSNTMQTPQQQQKVTNTTNTANIRTSQKIKVIPRSNKTTPVSTPTRDETPPPTIAAGRSRRAIKPNPKYASEDLVTPKVVRNVASSTSRGALSAAVKSRKASTSSDDFYNRNSDDEYESNTNDMDNDYDEAFNKDKAYKVNEKDAQDSDFSDIEEEPVRVAKLRGRPRKEQPSTPALAQQANNKLQIQTPTPNVKRPIITPASSSNMRSAPSQLQQIRRSLASANAQRNLNILTGSGTGTALKRKLEESPDSTDHDTSYTVKRKQLLPPNSSAIKAPIRETKINATSTPIVKSRLIPATNHTQQQQQNMNGSNKINNSQTLSSRRAIEISAKSNPETVNKPNLRQSTTVNNTVTSQKIPNPPSTQAKMLAAKVTRLRSGSPKPPLHRDKTNNGSTTSIPSASASTLNAHSKMQIDKPKAPVSQSTLKSKLTTTTTSPHNALATAISPEKPSEIKEDSPNSTMDDFETMPTFTIVNVNDIINKKGDVLITKSKSNSSSKTPTVIEFSESISLDDDDEEDEVDERPTSVPPKKLTPKLPQLGNKKVENKKSPLTRSSESLRKLPTQLSTSTKGANTNTSSSSTKPAPQILNHKLGLRNSRVTPKTTTLTTTLKSPDKPAPRILNSMVAKKTQPVKPLIANMDDSADESFPLSLDEDEEDDEEEETEDEVESRTSNLKQVANKTRKRQQQHKLMEVDTEDTESQNTEEEESMFQTSQSNNNANNNITNAVALTPKQNVISPQRRRRTPGTLNTPIVVSSNKKRLTHAAAKENSLAATNQQTNESTTGSTKQQANNTSQMANRKPTAEKVVISKQGDKIIKKITCFETWYVINTPTDIKRATAIKNQLEMPLIRLANNAKNICLPNKMWTSKVTLYELSPQTLGKGTYATFTGDLSEHNISEEDRGKYQPSCVMFRRSIEKTHISRMPYDRAVIFKNKTFYTNIEGKNVRLVGAPSIINLESEVEILLEVIDSLTLQSDFVEHISIVQ